MLRALTGLTLLASFVSSSPAASAAEERTLVLDLAPFTPFGVAGEVFGVGTISGEVIHARLDVTFVSNDPGPWTFHGNFIDFPMPGFVGFDSVALGWDGVGTFEHHIESDGLNGTLAPPPGAPFWSWFFQFAGGTPYTPPGGGITLGPIDGTFTELTLTLVLASCPDGDPDLPWTDVGGALAGAAGTPTLSASGSLCAGEPLSLTLTDAAPLANAALVVGFSALQAPFKGGVLVPSPDAIVAGLPVDASGTLQLDLAWPVGIPSGGMFWLQEWIVDASAPLGFSASNGLEACVP